MSESEGDDVENPTTPSRRRPTYPDIQFDEMKLYRDALNIMSEVPLYSNNCFKNIQGKSDAELRKICDNSAGQMRRKFHGKIFYKDPFFRQAQMMDAASTSVLSDCGSQKNRLLDENSTLTKAAEAKALELQDAKNHLQEVQTKEAQLRAMTVVQKERNHVMFEENKREATAIRDAKELHSKNTEELQELKQVEEQLREELHIKLVAVNSLRARIATSDKKKAELSKQLERSLDLERVAKYRSDKKNDEVETLKLCFFIACVVALAIFVRILSPAKMF